MHIKQIENHLEQLKSQMMVEGAKFLRPLLEEEFKKVQKKNKSLKMVLFGNGDFYFQFNDGQIRWRYLEQVPKYAHKLWHLCNMAVGDREYISFLEDHLK